MKENHKFSLKAFFCSWGSRSKLSKLVLLGAPFFLVRFFTLNVCATSVAVPGADGLLVTPSGGVSSPIHNVLKMDTGSINSSLWVALGLDPIDLYDIVNEANEAYEDGNQVVYDAIIDSLNAQDSGSGDLLNYVIESSFQATSQSGYVGKISIPDDIWSRVNKATKNGLTLSFITSPPDNVSYTDFVSLVSELGFNVNLSGYRNDINSILNSSRGYQIIEFTERGTNYHVLYLYEDRPYQVDTTSTSFTMYFNPGVKVFRIYANTPSMFGYSDTRVGGSSSSYRVVKSSFGISQNKSLGVAQPFISNKANENYDIVSKSSSYNPDTGKIEGARSVNLITPAYLSELVASLREGILSIPEALQRLGIGAIDTDQAIPIGVGFDIDTLSHVVAQSVPQEATAAATREAFRQLDNFTFYTPDDFIGVPSVSPLPVAMNWLAVQMQTMMGLTSFQNCWVVLSTLAVLSLIVGLIRLSK